jgi:formiminotetrahydrofolate cyclodeaminase
MIDQPLPQFLDELASKAPTPGGGSASAIMGAMAAALVSMVCNLTVGKQGYEAVEEEMKAVLTEAEAIRARFSELVRADIGAFNQVMAAYRLPKGTDEEKQQRSGRIQEALKVATEVPLDCARLCAQVIRLSRTVADRGNRNIVSDAGAAVMAAHAALKCAALNVYINAGTIKDQVFIQRRVEELERLLAECEPATAQIFLDVKNQL